MPTLALFFRMAQLLEVSAQRMLLQPAPGSQGQHLIQRFGRERWFDAHAMLVQESPNPGAHLSGALDDLAMGQKDGAALAGAWVRLPDHFSQATQPGARDLDRAGLVVDAVMFLDLARLK